MLSRNKHITDSERGIVVAVDANWLMLATRLETWLSHIRSSSSTGFSYRRSFHSCTNSKNKMPILKTDCRPNKIKETTGNGIYNKQCFRVDDSVLKEVPEEYRKE
jgi:hypothetical protein